MSDAIVIGAGHNGLVCAALLAHAGKKVTVVERMEQPGGLSARSTFGPDDGYTVPGLFHETGLLRRALVSALGLVGHGLQRHVEAEPILAASAEHKGVLLHRDAAKSRAELDALEKGDGAGYVQWRAFIDRVAPFVRNVLDQRPPPMSPSSMSELMSLGKAGLALRRLGKDDMIELMRVAPMCAADWLNEQFSTPLLPAALSSPAIQGTWYGPWSAGTAANLLVHESTCGPGIRGGGSKLIDALVKALAAKGGSIKTSSPVTQILVEKGRATGVELEGGEQLKASVVACACDPKTALLDLVPVVRSRGTTAKVHLALDGELVFNGRAGERISRAAVGAHVDDLERAADAIKYGEMSERPHLDVWVPSVEDASCAPDGKDVVSLTVSFAPHGLKGGWTDAARDLLAERALAVLEEVAPGTGDKIIEREVLAPPDIEERYGMKGGHIHHVEHALDQLLFMRPAAAVAHYATPIGGLFLCGSGSHPGGGVSGQPGALAARTILKG
jgi:phytoene dehydrogenase-like protein